MCFMRRSTKVCQRGFNSFFLFLFLFFYEDREDPNSKQHLKRAIIAKDNPAFNAGLVTL